jgi:16S rRNA (guanine527-N7)-methyltransferase
MTAIQKSNSKIRFFIPRLERKINVISRKDIDALYTKHTTLTWNCKGNEIRPGTFVLDVGTGGGFLVFLYDTFPNRFT